MWKHFILPELLFEFILCRTYTATYSFLRVFFFFSKDRFSMTVNWVLTLEIFEILSL